MTDPTLREVEAYPILSTPLSREAGVTVDWALEPDGLPSVSVSSDESSWGLFLTFTELREFIANAETILLWAAHKGVPR